MFENDDLIDVALAIVMIAVSVGVELVPLVAMGVL